MNLLRFARDHGCGLWRAAILAVSTLAPLLPAFAMAQTFPSRTITLVVPFAAGGGTDTIARLIAQRLTERLGVGCIVENRSGASGAIAARAVIAAAPDGHTILIGTAGTQAVSPSLNPRIGFDPRVDLVPVARIGVTPNLLVVHPGTKADTVADLVAFAKAHPGAIPYASSGTGTVSHLSAVLFAHMAGIEMNHVPYRGAGPANNDLVAGVVTLMFDTPISLLPLVQAGRLRALAVTSMRRMAVLPDVPTLQEAGYPDYVSELWFGAFVPKGTSPELVARLRDAVMEAVGTPQIAERMRELGVEPQPGGPAVLAETLSKDLDRWGTLVRETGISPQ